MLFESMAKENSDKRTNARQALVLSETRINERLGKWLKTDSPSEYKARLSYVKNDFESIIRQACEETGFDQHENIIKTLETHLTPQDRPIDIVLKMASTIEANCKECGCDCASDCSCDCDCSSCGKKGFDPSEQKVDEGGASALDALDGDEKKEKKSKSLVENLRESNQFIKHRGNEWVVTKHDDGSVISTHDSKEKAEDSFQAMMMHKHAAEWQDNTNLDGPSPKMDKKRWTPESVSQDEYEDGKNETGEHTKKDATEPIKALNEGPPGDIKNIKEIGEKNTTREKLPANKGDAGFDDGGVNKGPNTKTFGKGKHEVDPVTKKTEATLSFLAQ